MKMPFVITENSTVNCDDLGTAQLKASQSKLTVGGSKALVKNDLDLATISGCPNTTDPNTGVVKCTTILSTAGGVASKLKVDGKGVLHKDITCNTNGIFGGKPRVASVHDAGQSKLKTV
jgi:hypothetical protein